MKNGLKIVVIGAGSSYTPELIEGLIQRQHELPLRELWLVDIDDGREKMEIIAALTRRMLVKAGLAVRVETRLEREEALRGADYVCSQFRAGCLEARISDERISLKYGLIGQETNGLGGFANACRDHPHRPADRRRHGASLPRCLAAQLHQSVGHGDRSRVAPQQDQGGGAVQRTGNHAKRGRHPAG